jgi:hypothetical protein
MVVVFDCLLGVACKLGLPFAISFLLFSQRILLVRLVVLGDFWVVFVVGYQLAN